MSFPRYPKYKDSGVEWLGEVPEHWRVERFKSVFRERDDRSTDGEEMLLSVSAYTGVTPRSEIIADGDHLTRADTLSGYKRCSSGDLVMNIMLAWNRGLAFTRHDGIVSPAYCVFSVVDDSDVRFLNYLVRSDPYIHYFKAFSAGVIDSRLRLYPDVFEGLKCGLPSGAEQRMIADFLDAEIEKIDTLIAEQRDLAQLLLEKRQALVSRSVTEGLQPGVSMTSSDVRWHGPSPAHWRPGLLRQLIAKIESGTSVNAADEPASSEEIGVLKTSCVYRRRFDPNENKTVLPEDIARVSCPLSEGSLIVSRMNTPELVGAAGYVDVAPPNLYLPDRLWQVTVKNADARYVYWWTLSASYRGQVESVCTGTSASMKNLGQDDFAAFRISVPPLEEQYEIVSYLNDVTAAIDELIVEAGRTTSLFQERREALISAAVTGKIDVRNYAADQAEAA